jgi:hypothetical protein
MLPIMNLVDHLPASLRAPEPAITKFAVGLSGAGVYRVEAGGTSYVLKISGEAATVADWETQVAIARAAGDAGIAPRVIHVDEARRSVLSEFVVDRGFAPWLGNPQTRPQALAALGQTLRRVHELPRIGAEPDRIALLDRIHAGLAGFALPGLVRDAVARMRAEPVPPLDRPLAMSHNDVNPTNIAFDGTRIVLLDWDTAAPSDVYYDIAAIALFTRLDDASCCALLEAHDGSPVAGLPVRFHYCKRLCAVLCGTIFTHLARIGGHGGATGGETLANTPGLAELLPRMRDGSLNPGSPAGQWAIGLALFKAAR